MSDPSIKIREAGLNDFESIYRFINKLEGVIFNKEILREIFIENISNKRNIYLIAEHNDLVVGFISCHIQKLLHHAGLVGEIQEMFVEEEYRKLKIGKCLINDLKYIVKGRGLVQLEVTSSHKRVDAHRFYEREEFKHTHKKFVLVLEKPVDQ